MGRPKGRIGPQHYMGDLGKSVDNLKKELRRKMGRSANRCRDIWIGKHNIPVKDYNKVVSSLIGGIDRVNEELSKLCERNG